LHPETPDEGLALADLFAGRGFDLNEMYTKMKGLMDAEGLPYGERSHTYNSRLAQELGKWADTKGSGDAFHDAMFRAYFVDGKNIAEIDALIDIALGVGLDAAEAREVLTRRSFKEQVDADWQRSRDYGITGVPTFVAAGQAAVGAQPYESLEKLVLAQGAGKRGA
jgi:predicted DsbA family dithiol-disulfide isomerase